MHVKCKVNGNCLKMKSTPCIFQPDLNVSEDVGWSKILIQLNPHKTKTIKIPVFNKANKDVWLEKGTAIGNLEIVSAAIPIEMKNIQVDDETFKMYQKGNSHIQELQHQK